MRCAWVRSFSDWERALCAWSDPGRIDPGGCPGLAPEAARVMAVRAPAPAAVEAARRRVCVVTGTRAEYGLLYWLLRELDQHPDAELQLLVTGAHLDPRFGDTWRAIEDDGFHIHARVHMSLSSDAPAAVVKSMALVMAGVADAFERLCPDMVVVLGDRYEALAVATAAVLGGIPVAHIHGGEVTEGAIDDSIRHAITKLASLHFTAAEAFSARVIRMGEPPDRVHTVGAPGLEYLRRLPTLDRRQLEESLGIALRPPVLLVTYHPATRGTTPPREAAAALTQALDAFTGATVIVTGVNADTGREVVAAELRRWLDAQSPDRARGYASLGQPRYLNLLRQADVVVGNSSSGIIEAPAAGTPTVNIGTRQHGRPWGPSIIGCEENSTAIAEAISRALSRRSAPEVLEASSLYGDGEVSNWIARILVEADLSCAQHDQFTHRPHAADHAAASTLEDEARHLD